jgi:hypothetical protein
MVRGISGDQQVRAGLMAAYLRDQVVGGTSHLLSIGLCNEKRAELADECCYVRLREAANAVVLAQPVVEDLIAIVGGCARSKRLTRVVHDLADMVRHDFA